MNSVCQKLETVLESEREALLQGDLEKITALMAEKEALVDEMQTLDRNTGDIAPLREKVSRNNALFDSALAGIRAVVGRLGNLQSAPKQLDTYDSAGRRFSIGTTVESKLEKRA